MSHSVMWYVEGETRERTDQVYQSDGTEKPVKSLEIVGETARCECGKEATHALMVMEIHTDCNTGSAVDCGPYGNPLEIWLASDTPRACLDTHENSLAACDDCYGRIREMIEHKEDDDESTDAGDL